jgi:hypothetical protein
LGVALDRNEKVEVRKIEELRIRERAEQLIAELDDSKDFRDAKAALLSFLSDMDGCSDYSPCIGALGDDDYADLFLDSLTRRGKTPLEEWAPRILCGHEIRGMARAAIEKLVASRKAA